MMTENRMSEISNQSHFHSFTSFDYDQHRWPNLQQTISSNNIMSKKLIRFAAASALLAGVHSGTGRPSGDSVLDDQTQSMYCLSCPCILNFNWQCPKWRSQTSMHRPNPWGSPTWRWEPGTGNLTARIHTSANGTRELAMKPMMASAWHTRSPYVNPRFVRLFIFSFAYLFFCRLFIFRFQLPPRSWCWKEMRVHLSMHFHHQMACPCSLNFRNKITINRSHPLISNRFFIESDFNFDHLLSMLIKNSPHDDRIFEPTPPPPKQPQHPITKCTDIWANECKKGGRKKRRSRVCWPCKIDTSPNAKCTIIINTKTKRCSNVPDWTWLTRFIDWTVWWTDHADISTYD